MNPTFHYIIMALWTLMVFVFVMEKEKEHDSIAENAETQKCKCKDAREMLSVMSANYTAEMAEHKRDIKRLEKIIAEKDKEIERLNKVIDWWENVARKVKLGGCKK